MAVGGAKVAQSREVGAARKAPDDAAWDQRDTSRERLVVGDGGLGWAAATARLSRLVRPGLSQVALQRVRRHVRLLLRLYNSVALCWIPDQGVVLRQILAIYGVRYLCGPA